MAVAEGTYHTLFLTTDGKLYNWIFNTEENLRTDLKSTIRDLGQVFEISEPVKNVASGSEHSLLLTKTGKVISWGDNGFGQLGREGDSTFEGVGEVDNLEGDIIQVAAGRNHSLALTKEGKVYGWGGNSFGKINLSGEASYIPEEIKGLPERVSRIACGSSFVMALTEGGRVFIQGNEFWKQFTDNNWNPDYNLGELIGIEGKVVEIAAGHHHCLALTSEGEIWSWGTNERGQLGISEAREWEPFFGQVQRVMGKAKNIAAGHSHSLAILLDDTVVGWGWNKGNGLIGAGAEFLLYPVEINGWEPEVFKVPFGPGGRAASYKSIETAYRKLTAGEIAL